MAPDLHVLWSPVFSAQVRRSEIMARLILAIAVTIAIVVFAMANMHFVALSLVVGQPVQIRLIFLLMSCFAAGAISFWFFLMVRKMRVRRRSARGSAAREKPGGLEEQLDLE
jgi:uncharacterized integral membrane protein